MFSHSIQKKSISMYTPFLLRGARRALSSSPAPQRIVYRSPVPSDIDISQAVEPLHIKDVAGLCLCVCVCVEREGLVVVLEGDFGLKLGILCDANPGIATTAFLMGSSVHGVRGGTCGGEGACPDGMHAAGTCVWGRLGGGRFQIQVE